MPTLSDIKAYLGITDNSQDIRLQVMLDSVLAWIYWYVWHSFPAKWNYDVTVESICSPWFVCLPNVTKLVAIDSVPFTWVLNKDYRIIGRKIEICECWEMCDCCWCDWACECYKTLTVEAWYDPMPSWLSSAIYLMMDNMKSQGGNGCDGWVLVSYTVWEESERYADNSSDIYKNNMAMVENLLKPYKIICTNG